MSSAEQCYKPLRMPIISNAFLVLAKDSRLLALVASDDLFQCQTTGSWRKHGHGHGHRLWLRRRLRPGFWHRLSFWHRDRPWLWLPIRQTHKIFLHRLVTHEFGIHANRNVSHEESHVAIMLTRTPDAAAMFERS